MRLEPQSQHYIFQCYDWLSFWQETVGDHSIRIKPWIAVVLNEEEQVRMIFPLGIRRHWGIRVLEFLGGESSDYLGPLIHDKWMSNIDKIQLAWNRVLKEIPAHDIKHFIKLPAKWGIEENPILKIWKSTLQGNSYSATLPSDFDEFRSKLRKKLRQDNNRQRRRLSERGLVVFEIANKNDNELQVALDVMIKQKRQRYQDTGVPDIFSQEIVRQFYKMLSEKLSGEGKIHFSLLNLENEILASHWGATYRGRFYYLMPTYAGRQWGTYSPGRLLLENLIEWSIQHDFKVFDFTVGGEDYKKDWCDTKMSYFEHLSVAKPFGMAYFGYIRLKRRARNSERTWRIVKFFYSWLRMGNKINNNSN